MKTSGTLNALEIEYQNIQEEMRGISPKLSLYATLKLRLEEIEKKLGHQVPAIKTRGEKRFGHQGKKKRYFDTRQRV